MTDQPQALLARLTRPKLLVRAARFGLADYDRGRDLARVLRRPVAPPPAQAVADLIEEEDALETRRKAGGVTYSPARHIDVLIALMAEARLIARADPA